MAAQMDEQRRAEGERKNGEIEALRFVLGKRRPFGEKEDKESAAAYPQPRENTDAEGNEKRKRHQSTPIIFNPE